MTKRPVLSGEPDQQAYLSTELQAVFGENVRVARVKASMTQAELSERSGVSREDVSRIENGQLNLTLRTMTRLATVLDGDVSVMLQATGTTRHSHR